MRQVQLANTKLRFTEVVARKINLIAVERFIFERRADADRAAQHHSTLMIDVRADWTNAIGREDSFHVLPAGLCVSGLPFQSIGRNGSRVNGSCLCVSGRVKIAGLSVGDPWTSQA